MNRGRYREHDVPPRSDIRGSLERHVGKSPLERLELEAMARATWRKTGTLTVFHWQRMDQWQRAILKAIGEELYSRKEM